MNEKEKVWFDAIERARRVPAGISTGNEKTGIPSFNLLAGSCAHAYDGASGLGICPCAGACNCDCPGCYAKKCTRFPAVFARYLVNTETARTDPDACARAVVEWVRRKRKKPRFFRLHDSGDFVSLEYMESMDRAAQEIAAQGVTMYTYTKRIDLVKEFIKKHGRAPAFTLNLSTWPGIVEAADLAAAGLLMFPRFEYDDGTRPELASVHHCPAVDAQGNRTGTPCKDCGRCALAGAGNIWAVYAH